MATSTEGDSTGLYPHAVWRGTPTSPNPPPPTPHPSIGTQVGPSEYTESVAAPLTIHYDM